MVDDLKNRGPADRSRVNVHEAWELDWWARKWGVTAAQLKGAVARVGVMTDDVAAMLSKTM